MFNRNLQAEVDALKARVEVLEAEKAGFKRLVEILEHVDRAETVLKKAKDDAVRVADKVAADLKKLEQRRNKKW